jgi:hypothetical protein
VDRRTTPTDNEERGGGDMRIGFGGRRPTGASVAVAVAALALLGCAAQGPGTSDVTTNTPTPTSPIPLATASASIEPLDDGEYRAAVYVPGELHPEPLFAGTLVDLGGGCLGLESDHGERSLVAFPVGTTLRNGRVSTVGMDSFGIGQPLRYGGWMDAIAVPTGSLAVPDDCPAEVTDVFYFIPAKSAGTGTTADD